MAVTKETKKEAVVLLLIIGFSAAFRFYHLTGASIWVDEAWTISIVKNSLQSILNTCRLTDYHPPLYYFFMHYWTGLFGDTSFVVRLPSVIFDLISTVVLYFFVRDLAGKRAAWISALLYSCASAAVYTAQEARMYPMLTMLILLSAYNFYLGIKNYSLLSWLCHAIFLTMAMYTQYIAVLVGFVFQLTFILLLIFRKVRGKNIFYWSIALFLIFFLYLPGLSLLESRIGERRDNTPPGNLAGAINIAVFTLDKLGTGFTQQYSLESNKNLPGIILFLAMLYGIFVLIRRSPRDWLLPFFIIFLPGSITLFSWIYTGKQVFNPIHFTFTIPYICLFTGIGCADLSNRKFLRVAVPLIIALFIIFNALSLINWYFNSYYARENWRAIVKVIQQHEKPGDVIVVQTAHRIFPFRYNYRGGLTSYAVDNLNMFGSEKLTPYKRVFLVQNCPDVTDPGLSVQRMLENRGIMIAEYKEDNYLTTGVLTLKLFQLKNPEEL
ncbi:MAG: glycosyltransferase family 39 protein [Chloroflexi bacterium]|nr:glycosyltransferase family 39 protein [Chloroflexota bacterium]